MCIIHIIGKDNRHESGNRWRHRATAGLWRFRRAGARRGGEPRTVTAAAISQVTKSRASGRHYSALGQFPFVVGIDGVGRLDNGQRVYFILPRMPYGSMA
jgi:hypothetical protein